MTQPLSRPRLHPVLAVLVTFGLACSASAPQAAASPAAPTAARATTIGVPTLPAAAPSQPAAPPSLSGCQVFPDDNIWNLPVDTLPLDPRSDAYVASIGAGANVHADFGQGDWPPGSGSPIGIPYVVVPGAQPTVTVVFTYHTESDPGGYPIPPNPLIEGGPNSDGDRHILLLDDDNCVLYELYSAYPQQNGTWRAGSGAIYDLSSNALRPETWTSADAAGLPILPGLVRYEEVAAGEINHALRFTAESTQGAFIWPARHEASDITDLNVPPMGQRFRLKANYDISPYSPNAQVILRALKKYGLILSDNGGDWFISGVPSEQWDNDVLHELDDVVGADFEAVWVKAHRVDPNSGQTQTPNFVFLPGLRR